MKKKLLAIFSIFMLFGLFVPSVLAAGEGLELAFAYTISDDTATAVEAGLNSGLTYEVLEGPGQGWGLLSGAGLGIISGYGIALTCRYQLYLGDTSVGCKEKSSMSYNEVITAWKAYLNSDVVQSNLDNIVGFALSDDWYYYGGEGKKLFQDMTAAVHELASGHRSICIVTANTSFAQSAQGYAGFAAAQNFSSEGCDMVGIYLYPTINTLKPLTNFDNAIAGLVLNGMDTAVTPVIGIAQSYNTTGAEIEEEVKHMCDNGATSIGFFAYNTAGYAIPAESQDLRDGMKRGIDYCGGAKGLGAFYVPGTGDTGSDPYADINNPDEEDDGNNYYDPGKAVTPTNSGEAVTPATSLPEALMSPIFPQLGNAPATATASCSVVAESGGLVPCGRNTDDPGTDWNECDACDLCAVILMGQLTIEFLMKMAGIVSVLSITFAGFLYIFAVGRASLVSKAKDMVKNILVGFIIVSTAWVVVNSILTILGYIDPIGGAWYTIC